MFALFDLNASPFQHKFNFFFVRAKTKRFLKLTVMFRSGSYTLEFVFLLFLCCVCCVFFVGGGVIDIYNNDDDGDV